MTEKYILLVEDNLDEVVLAERAFNACRICTKLVVVCDGRAALDFLFGRGEYSERDINEKPSLILLDLNLPVVNGLQVLKLIRAAESTRKIPVVVLTSSTEERDHIESCRLGASDYVCKPTAFTQFLEVVKQIKARWLEPNGN